jgi:hypothetical protein
MLVASAALGGLMLPGTSAIAQTQAASPSPQPVGWMAAVDSGSISGTVRDETGLPVAGVMVSAIGSTTAVAVTDRNGRFEISTLSPGPYLVRAHLSGYIAPRAQVVEVRASSRAAWSVALRRAGSTQVLAAGLGEAAEQPPAPSGEPETPDSADRGESIWRLRHARRGILKDSELPDLLVLDRNPLAFGSALESSVKLATSFFTDTPFSGQVNLLTTGSFDTPQQLFSGDNFSRGIAYVRLGAPAGAQADWTVRGALSQADLSSWILAGSYTTRVPARHRYELGLSYSTQRYDGGNPFALRDVSDGSRNAGEVYGFDTFTITPALAVTYGGRYARYDYLDNRSLLSPSVEVTVSPVDGFRVSGELSRRAQAPGAEEFLPPADTGIWLPPQRTFSSIERGRRFEAERVTQVGVTVERDFGGSTLSFGAFRQQVEDQLVTLFGPEVPQRWVANVGHYFVGNAGNVDALGCNIAFRTPLAGRVTGSVAYSMAEAQLEPADRVGYLILLAPSAVRPRSERLHGVSTSVEANVPETATRVLVLYRVGNGFAQPASTPDAGWASAVDSRFDVQVRQSLPFLNFTSAKWEMLVAVRNFFRENIGHESVYDELLVVNPPKRLVGGVTMRF